MTLGADPGHQEDAPECASPWQLTAIGVTRKCFKDCGLLDVVGACGASSFALLPFPEERMLALFLKPAGSRGPFSGLSPEDRRQTTVPTGLSWERPCGYTAQSADLLPDQTLGPRGRPRQVLLASAAVVCMSESAWAHTCGHPASPGPGSRLH